jgi:hypothetical protein
MMNLDIINLRKLNALNIDIHKLAPKLFSNDGNLYSHV